MAMVAAGLAIVVAAQVVEAAAVGVGGTGAPVFGDGSPFEVPMLRSKFFGAEAVLVTSGIGRYLVFFPGLGYVQNADGGAYELDLQAFLDR